MADDSLYTRLGKLKYREKMSLRLDFRTVAVTGAGRGIGRVLCMALASAGAKVFAISRSASDLQSLVENDPEGIRAKCLDINNWKETRRFFQHNPVDFLVNNAAITDMALLKELGDISEEEVDRVFNTNVKALINTTRVMTMSTSTARAVVNISCVLGERGAPNSSVYSASKGAADQLTRAMAVEYGALGIRVNSVNPTIVRCPMTEEAGWFNPKNQAAFDIRLRTPLRRLAEPYDIIGAVLFLLSKHSSMITGVSLPVDGGLSAGYRIGAT